ncbi:MAG TPA: cysteine desulfurase family protein [Saprospiraceae bacterium]|nr:cysteine desulfurase family protein [Saprospiraceae bacterium]HPI05045.1 cysteine desulfurase family protein [Saprospiraceae bacterium]
MRVYFDNAATTAISEEVIDAMLPALRNLYGNPSSIHAEGRAARAALESARKTVAHCIGAGTGEIFFTSGGTESNNMAIKCAVRDLGVQRIISSPTEHHCGTHAIETVKKTKGVEVVWLPVDALGRIDYEALETALADQGGKKTLVSLMHANNEIGTMTDIARVSGLCRQYGALFHSDTVQTVGHFPINVQEIPVNFLSGAAHKFHGPKGVGFIYINPDTPIKPFIDGGAQERNMRGGTENVYGIIGMAKALELACGEMESRTNHIKDIRNYLKDRLLQEFEDIQFNGDLDGASLYTVLSVAFPPSPKNELLLLSLDIAGISCSGGSACSSGSEKGSHVLEAINADPARKSIRFSFSHYNTRDEVDFLVEKLKNIVPVKKSEVDSAKCEVVVAH